MGKIFNKTKTESAKAPEEPETPGEIKHTEDLSNDEDKEESKEKENVQYQEVPVCMSQVQINNLVIEMHMMLKHIISKIDEWSTMHQLTKNIARQPYMQK